MAFGGGNQKNSRATLSEINVTPLVDVMLVLLIMFMVTTPLMQQGIEVELPKTASSGVQAKEEPLTIVIQKNQKLSIGKEPIALDKLGEKLKAVFRSRRNKQVYIQADRSVEYGVVAETMAEIRGAGVYSIGMITLPKTQ